MWCGRIHSSEVVGILPVSVYLVHQAELVCSLPVGMLLHTMVKDLGMLQGTSMEVSVVFLHRASAAVDKRRELDAGLALKCRAVDMICYLKNLQ